MSPPTCQKCGVEYQEGSYAEHRVLPYHVAVIKEKEKARVKRARKAYRARTGYRPFHERYADLDVDRLAQIIREVDGNHDLGAGELAEAIVARLSSSEHGSASR